MPLPKRQPNYFQPQAKAYQPTMRDKAAGLLSGLFGDTYQTNLFSRGLLGSSGLGGGAGPIAGMGLLDMTPLGAAFALEEAGRKIGRGDRVGGVADAALAVVPIPAAARGAKRVARRVAPKAAKAAPRPGFVAYHGSPHTFDQFDTAKIGTGEGAQAYGHGLYFAENEGVARNYRDALTNKRVPDGEHIDKVAFSVVRAGPNMPDSELVPFVRNVYPDASDERVIQAINTARANQQAGSMYQVRINADPNDFLDWDAPLSAQRPAAQDALAKLGFPIRQAEDVVQGQDGRWYTTIGGKPQGRGWPDRGTAREAARVINEEAAINATRKAGDIVSGRRVPALDVSRELQDAGIPGIKYLDQGSRGVGQGSRNFVVFDPRIIDIMKRYGVAAPVAAAILAGTMQPPKGREPGA